VIALSKAGYGTIREIEELPLTMFLDLCEFENIQNHITEALMNKERGKA
jgi:hypothetical protein